MAIRISKQTKGDIKMVRMKFYGLGGQGVVTAGKVLSSAVSLYEDKYAVTIPAYGHERRGAPVYTDIIIDDKPVLVNCFVYEPDIVVVLDETIIQKHVDIAKGIHENTILVLNAGSQKTVEAYQEKYSFKKMYYVNATQAALETIGVSIPNGAVLGALARTGVVSIESVEKALKDFFGEKAGEKNADAARRSWSRTKEA